MHQQRRIAVLCAPYRTRTAAEIDALIKVKGTLLVRGWLPLFLPDTLADVLCDERPAERRIAVATSRDFVAIMAQVPHAIMVVIGERQTEGMCSDVEAWLDAGGDAPLHYEDVGSAWGAKERDGD